MIYVVETIAGIVSQVVACNDKEEAEECARKMCEENGIAYEYPISCDGEITNYSVQIRFAHKN